jgi:putative PIN family toxin of toxin-antitoxin system
VIRAVLDANVFISALIRPMGPPGQILDRWIGERSFALIASPAIVDELRRAARYDRVKRYVPLTPQEVEAWISSIQLTAEHVRPERSVHAVAADPDDDKYIDAAIYGDADFVVSGDRHLLELREFERILIVTPRAFLVKIAR